MNSTRQCLRRLANSLLVKRNLKYSCSAIQGYLSTSTPKYLSHHSIQNVSSCSMSVRFASTSPKKFEVINVQDEEDFKKRVIDLSSDTPVVVDFHATWCGPCKLLGPRLESILAEGQGKVVMAKVDIDEISELAMAYGVKSVPTVVGIKNGKVLIQFIGMVDDDQIRTFVKKLVLS